MLRGRVRSLVVGVLCAVMVLTALPLSSFAGAVDHKTAADPIATLAKIEAMNLPDMPQELADQLRGGFWPQIFVGGVLLTIAYLHYKWVTNPQWVLNNPAARMLWDEIRN